MCAAPRKNPPHDILDIIERVVVGEGGSTKILARAIGVSDSLIRTWFERDEDLKEVYETAREAHMHKLYIELLQMSRTGKGNVAGIIYTLKAKFKQFDQPGSGKLVDVNVIQANPVLVVIDHGTNAQWEAKLASQQRALTLPASTPHQLEAAHVDPVATFGPPSYLPPAYVPLAVPVTSMVPPVQFYDAPCWQAKA